MVDSFQKMVNELKESVQSSSTQIHEQVNLWQGRVKGVERELNIVKMEMSSELLGLKMLIKNEKEEKSTKEVDRREKRAATRLMPTGRFIHDRNGPYSFAPTSSPTLLT